MDRYSKLRHNLEDARARGATKFIVLLSTGSYNPVHVQHVNMFDTVKENMEQQDPALAVVAGFLSPSHDQYVRSKLKHNAIPSSERLQMIRDATSEHPLLAVHDWEASQNRFNDFTQVCRAVQEEIKDKFGPDVMVYYVCGTDHMRKCGLQKGMKGFGIVAVQRKGVRTPYLPKNAESDVIIVTGDFASGISSTEVRKRLKKSGKNANLSGLLHPAVAERMKSWLK